MTALGGCVRLEGSGDGIRRASAMLRAQRQYGSRPASIRSIEGAEFGIALFRSLPEDAFDDQPLSADDLTLVADIRIDNREELGAALKLKSAEIRTLADSAMFLLAWRHWGKDSLPRIIGEFAAAIHSVSDRTLVLVRDALGRRPLHYARVGNVIAFASMPTGILALPEFRRGLDLRGMAAGLLDVAQHGPHTNFRDVKRVLPGEIHTFHLNQTRSERWWAPSFDPLRLRRSEDYVDAYRAALDDAVQPLLRRESGNIGAHLSAGLDSSASAATAAMLKRPEERLIAFTSAPRPGFRSPAPRNRFADESRLAALTARSHGMKHVVVRSQSSLLKTIEHLPRLYQTPFWNIINLPWLWDINEQARHEGASIMLTGDGGNLTLNAGGLGILGDFVAQRRWVQWWHEARLAAKRRDIRWRGILFSSFEPRLPRSLIFTVERLFRGAGRLENFSFINRQWLDDPFLKRELASWRSDSGDSYRTRLQLLLGEDLSAYNKGCLAQAGIDMRSPLVNRRVVEFSLRLPREQLFHDGMSRPLAHEALSNRVPAEVLNTTARGYQAADWFEHVDTAVLHAMVEEIAPNTTVRELIDVPRLRSTIDRWPTGGFHKFDVHHPLGSDLPMAIAAGYFVLQAEKWLAGDFD